MDTRTCPESEHEKDKPHFVTFVRKRRRVLSDWARQVVLDCCMHDRGRKYNLRVAVVMPDHVHMILTPLIAEVGESVTS
ncbi:MAG TPA: hypothetical protein VJ728_12965 [Candidatus Binataceae bacterium]|nr:hypothetical protein [Candidatus Binataceae bacterium]